MAQMHDLRPAELEPHAIHSLEQWVRRVHPFVWPEDMITTEFIYQGRLRKELFIVLYNRPGAAYTLTARGLIRFVRGPYAWNPMTIQDLTRLNYEMEAHETPILESYVTETESLGYRITEEGITTNIEPSHDWHPEHGAWLREVWHERIASEENLPFYDFVPLTPRGHHVSRSRYPTTSYIKAQTVEAAISERRLRRFTAFSRSMFVQEGPTYRFQRQNRRRTA